jgi:uncharacterized membrane protein YphA (DoxX/SURF4 family)
LAAILIATGLDKFLNYWAFIDALSGYAFLPRSAVSILGFPIILSEIWAGLGLCVPSLRRTAAFVAALLIFNFTLAFVWSQFLSQGSDCGCWYALDLGMSKTTHILTNSGLFVLLAIVYIVNPEPGPVS